MNIAIVGVGIAGANTLRYILTHENFTQDDKITLFETRSDLGRGLAYEKDTKYKVLNISHVEMSVEDDPMDFVNWMEENDKELNFEDLIPRIDVGEYIEERYEDYFNHPQVNHIQQEVTDIGVLEGKEGVPHTYRIKTDDWLEEEFSAVFLTLGHPDYNDHYDLEGTDNYVHSPYPLAKVLAEIKPTDRVGIIGSGPTGIDAYRYLAQETKMEVPVHFLVRKKAFSLAGIVLERDEDYAFSMTHEWIEEKKKANGGHVPLQNILDLIAGDFAAEGASFDDTYERVKGLEIDMQRKIIEENDQELALILAYFERFVEFFPVLFGLLTGSDREELLEGYDKRLEVFRSFTPVKTVEWLIEEMDAGKLSLDFGLKDIIVLEDGKFMVKGSKDVVVDILINAGGFNRKLEANFAKNKLLANLFDRNLILADKEGKDIVITWPKSSILNKEYGDMDNMYLMGLWVNTTHYRNNDFRSILSVSEKVAKNFMDHVYPKLA